MFLIESWMDENGFESFEADTALNGEVLLIRGTEEKALLDCTSMGKPA